MACRRQILCCLVFIALLPALVSCIRPFRAPRNLFKQGTSSLTLPEGVRIIRRQASDELFVETSHDLEEQHIRSRFRRDSPPGIDTTNVSLNFDYMISDRFTLLISRLLWAFSQWTTVRIFKLSRRVHPLFFFFFYLSFQQPLGSYDEMYMYWPESKKQ